MNPDSSQKINLSTNSLFTRRKFLKKSFLTYVSATLAAKIAKVDFTQGVAAHAEEKADSAPGAGVALSYPLVPYGTGRPVYLADLNQCQPASALTRTWSRNAWKLVDFEANHTKGTMLTVGQDTSAPDVEYSLRQTGWHAIYFGIKSDVWPSRLQVRFRDEPVFTLLTPNTSEGIEEQDAGIEDIYWKCALVGGANDAIVLRQLKVQIAPEDPNAHGNIFTPCWLAYIKLVPLSEAEVAALLTDRKRSDTRRLFATDDAFSSTYELHFTSEADIHRQLEPYRDSDFSRIYWEAGMGDVTYFPSKTGTLLTFAWMKAHYRRGDRLVAQTYSDFQARGIDPFRVALDYSHEVGLEFHASYRVGGFHFPAPQDEWNSGGLYQRHPEWRVLDREGREQPKLSYAFPGVQQFVFSIFREVASYPVDGVCLLFNRGLPVLGYEAPLVASFQTKHGLDPRRLAGNDPRWLAHRAEVLTNFMREFRRRMRDEEQQQHRKPIAITVVVMSSREENYGYGLDLEAWVKEGLIDTLVPYSSVHGIKSSLPSWEDPRTADFFIRLTKNTACKLALNLMPRQMAPETYMHRAHSLYEAGVEHLLLWDTFTRTNYDRSWSRLRRLGHREELARWAASGRPPVERPHSRLTRIGDWNLSYATPG